MNLNITNRLKTFVILAVLFICAQFPANAATVDAKQKVEFEKIVENYILSNPEIIERALLMLEQQRKDEEASAVEGIIENNWEQITNPKDLFIGGNPDGDVTLVEFFDYNCFYCKKSFEDLSRILTEDKNLKLVMYEFPVLSQSSLTAAQVSLAARIQGKYWQFHAELIAIKGKLTDEIIFATAKKIGLDVDKVKKDMLSDEVEQGISFTRGLAEALKINGTPAFIINGKLFGGAIGYDAMKAEITAARKENLLKNLPNN